MRGALSAGEENALLVAPLCGIDIYIHAFLPYYALYRVLGGLAAYGSTGHDVMPYLFFNMAAVTILFGTVLIHEFGHSGMAIWLGGAVPKILLWPFGGLAYCSFSREVKNQLAVSIAGPLTHIPLFAIWFLLFKFTSGECDSDLDFSSLFHHYYDFDNCLWREVLYEGMFLQIMLFAFNVFLPIYPLDGGKIFICLIALCCNCQVPTIAKICIGTSGVLCGVLLYLSFITQNWMGGFLCLWLLYQIYQMYQHLQSGNIASHPLFEHMPGGRQNPNVVEHRDEFGRYNRVESC